MTFVNQIAEIIHGVVDEFHGARGLGRGGVGRDAAVGATVGRRRHGFLFLNWLRAKGKETFFFRFCIGLGKERSKEGVSLSLDMFS